MPAWTPSRSRSFTIQALVVTVILGAAVLLAASTVENLRLRGIPVGFDFLWIGARFVISESLLRFNPSDPYWWAIVVGIGNTLFVSSLVLVFSAVLGLVVGIGRLSSNPLVSASCRVWVEIARNTPPIVLLIFLYSLWWKVLPPVTDAITPLPGVHLSMRGIFVPWPDLSLDARGLPLLGFATAAVLLVGRVPVRARWSVFVLSAVAATSGLWLAAPTVEMRWPRFTGANYRGGLEITPELSTIVIGLTLYTTGFVAEIVRGGILAVGTGQWEAGRAIGLRRGQILRFVVIPQMMRIVMPPMTSQAINVVKNSTLSIAVGYPDFLAVMGTVINKSSHALEGVAIILAVYLALNLSLSLLLNWYNRRIALVER